MESFASVVGEKGGAVGSKRKKDKDAAGPNGASDDVYENLIENSPYPYDKRMNKKQYEKTLLALQVELVKAQRWIKDEGERIVIIFEGRDAAGKGGTIKRFTQYLNPRGARVVALLKPTEAERGQWYFQRYIAHLPTKGEIVFFDRSWYNRGGVEPVMGFCTPAECREFMRQAPELERGLVLDGIRLFKLWFAVGQEEQRKRFDARRTDPLKQWKLSPMDIESVNRWNEYTVARDRMFFSTHTRDAPWTVIRSDDKRRARINAIRHVLAHLPYPDKDKEVIAETDDLILGPPDLVNSGTDDYEFVLRRRD